MAVVARGGAQLARLVAQQHRVVRLRHEHDEQQPQRARPDQQHVVRPLPAQVLVDEAADQRAEGGAQERRCGEDEHGRLQRVAREKVADAAAGHGQEGAAGEAVQEAHDEHRGHVLGHGRGDQPDHEEGVRDDVYGAAAVEFGERREEHGSAPEPEDEQG